jgi:hypothetical protein
MKCNITSVHGIQMPAPILPGIKNTKKSNLVVVTLPSIYIEFNDCTIIKTRKCRICPSEKCLLVALALALLFKK